MHDHSETSHQLICRLSHAGILLDADNCDQRAPLGYATGSLRGLGNPSSFAIRPIIEPPAHDHREYEDDDERDHQDTVQLTPAPLASYR